MPYSLVGGPALGFDLARLPAGDRVAGVLRVALEADPDDLARLAAGHPGPGRWHDWQESWRVATTDRTALRQTLPLAGGALTRAAAGDVTLLRRLETSLLGDVVDLDRLVRRELLDWTWLPAGPVAAQDPTASEAADVIVAAAAAAYLRDDLPAAERRAMAVPFLRADLPPREIGDIAIGSVREVLETLAAADDDVRREWRRVVDTLRSHTGQWAPAMHQATWALSLADRLRVGLDVHLAGVAAFSRGGFSARDAAYGVWNAVSGILQAGVVGDLLPQADAQVLLRPWREVYGTSSA